MVLIVLAKLGTQEAVGQFGLGLAITAPVMLLANLQLNAVQATDARREYRFGHYLALRLLTTALALAVIVGLAIGIGNSLVTVTVILGVGIAKAFESISEIYHGLLYQHHRMERVGWSLLLKGGFSVLAMTAGFCLWGGVVGGTFALAATWGLVTVFYDMPSTTWLIRKENAEPGNKNQVDRSKLKAPDAKHITGHCSLFTVDSCRWPIWEWLTLGRLAWLALPLGVVALFFTLSTQIPRYFIEHYLGEGQLGIFTALAYVTLAGTIISNALGRAASPRLASLYASGDLCGFRLLVLKLAGLCTLAGIAGVVVAVVLGRPILKVLYTPTYAEYSGLFAVIMAGVGLWCVATMFIYAATASRRQRSQAVAAAIVALATLCACAILIDGESLDGAAAATVVSGVAAVSAFGFIFATTGRWGATAPAMDHLPFATIDRKADAAHSAPQPDHAPQGEKELSSLATVRCALSSAREGVPS